MLILSTQAQHQRAQLHHVGHCQDLSCITLSMIRSFILEHTNATLALSVEYIRTEQTNIQR